MNLAGHPVSSAEARILRTFAGLDGVPGPMIEPRPSLAHERAMARAAAQARADARARALRALAGLVVVVLVRWLAKAPTWSTADQAPDTEPGHGDTSPREFRENRAERREPLGIGHLDLPWVGPIPGVGRSIHRLRAAGRNHTPRATLGHRTPVPVDVVPIIHARAARGSWAARWSGARVITRTSHHTYAPTTVVAGAVASLVLTDRQAITTQAARDTDHRHPGPDRGEERTVIDPTRGPTESRSLGALAPAGPAPRPP